MRLWGAVAGVLLLAACKGSVGATGPAGPQGPAGSPDTPRQVLSKLLTVDGADSGLDADYWRGLTPSAFQPAIAGTCPPGSAVANVLSDGGVDCVPAAFTAAAGGGLTLDGGAFAVDSSRVQARVGGTCAPGSTIQSILSDGGVVCAGLLRTLVVSPVGDEGQNGQALVAAVDSIRGTVSPTNPWLMPGPIRSLPSWTSPPA